MAPNLTQNTHKDLDRLSFMLNLQHMYYTHFSLSLDWPFSSRVLLESLSVLILLRLEQEFLYTARKGNVGEYKSAEFIVKHEH